MKTPRTVLLWIIIIILAIIPLLYFFARVDDSTFKDSAMGNWFATMIGAFVGILSALEINRLQQDALVKKNKKSH